MVSHYDPLKRKSIHRAVNACLAPLYSVEGMHVITVEGIGNRQLGLHPVQEILCNSHGSQCGFCTPGFVMSMYALLRSSKEPPTQEQIEESLAGNLCRCTGYRPILDAFRVFAKTDNSLYINCDTLSKFKDAKVICPSTGRPCECGARDGNDSSACGTLRPFSKSLSYSEIDGSYYSECELIFPSELVSRKPHSLYLKGSRDMMWFRPLKLQDVLDLKSRFPEAKLLVGNTEIGIETKFKSMFYQVIIATTHVPELNILRVKDSGLEIGASVTLTELLDTLKHCVAERDEHETSACSAFLEQLRWFAGCQIRNVASVGGNICTASPISDLNPLWMAARAQFNIIDTKGNMRTVFAREFFKGYRKVDLRSGEILLSVFLPFTKPGEYVKEFKQAHRRDDDIALVNAAMRVVLEQKGHAWSVIDASIVYGGVAPVPLSAVKTETFLKGKPWTSETLQCALQVLKEDIIIAENAPGGMVEFRQSLTASFFFKFFLLISYNIQQKTQVLQGFPDSYKSAVDPYKRPSSYGVQSHESLQKGTSVGLPVTHLAAKLQVTGEAEYADDVPMPYNGLHAALVLSKKPHARICFIDDSAAKLVPGFEGFFKSKDVPGGNDIGAVINDEELFASKFVTCVGQVIGIVVADTHENAKTASQKVHVEYEELPAVLCIKDALKVGSFHPNTEKILQKGDVSECFNSGVCQKIVEGEVQIGGQEHFYLEPNSTLIWTADGGNEVHMVSSTQAPQKHQKFVSHVLGLPMNKVVCKAKRLGGGFGGKETRSAFLAAAAAVPSYLLRRPVRITLDRDIDMMTTGQRHAFLGKYKVGFSEEGKVLALDLEIYNNGGNSLDLSLAVLERAMFHSDNVYVIENVRIRGKVCFTHIPSNTAFRGFGGPQGMFITENWIEHIARELGKRPEEIKEQNFHKEGHVLHYGQKLEQCRLQQVWNALKVSCDFNVAHLEVDKFNSLNRWKKRGIAMVPTKFGISFTTKFMNQAGALVQVYTDGTVLVTHGGVEMGQGLHTKVAQIAASAFNVPVSCVFISETSTDKVPNSSPTAASASSDMYGAAVLDACEQIKSRMEPIASKNKHALFAEIANACHLERIDLSAHGFYATPDIGFDWKSGKGKPFSYYTFGAAYAEVEVDTLTGDFHLREADIVMDLGNSLNPAIDIGQIEGGFVQGIGLFALEEVKWGDPAHQWIRPGYLFTQGPGTYKLPTVNDIPLKFKVSLLQDAPNPKAIHSSKAVGEPPLFLASAAFFAIKDAISAAREEAGNEGWFVLDSPATPERIRMACPDEFTKPFADSEFRAKLSV
ncbi:xanthine dehydrogenase 1 isoform X2 [Cryptomeria japonica]|nr:xanthine dehydrogenase 1 isoform X2 [Cryptomeria japonica]